MVNNLNQSEDIQLSLMAKYGDDTAFCQLVLRYIPFIKNRAASAKINGIEYDDLVQEGLLGLFSAVKSFNSNSNTDFSSYAFTCIKNRMLSACRNASRQKNYFLNSFISISDGLIDTPADSNTQPEEIVINKENLENFNNKIMSSLSPKERKVVFLRLSGYSYKEIANILSVSVKTVDNSLQSVRKKLKPHK